MTSDPSNNLVTDGSTQDGQSHVGPRKGDGNLSFANCIRAAIGFAVICGWVCVFTFGVSIGTTVYMHAINPDDPQNLAPTWDQAVAYWRLAQEKRVPQIDSAVFAKLTQRDVAAILSTQDGTANIGNSAVTVSVAKPVMPEGEKSEGKPTIDSSAGHEKQALELAAAHKASRTAALQSGEPAASSGPTTTFLNADDQTPVLMPIPNVQPQAEPSALKSWFAILFCNTIVNLSLLSCMASILGGLYFAILHPETEVAEKYGPEWYLMNAIQGFVMYLAILSGLLIIGEVPVEAVTTQKYIRLAGVISVLSFWAGFTPQEFFVGLIGRVAGGLAAPRKNN
jgi:hypothetical protein